jgi:CheY-specific phosphatase CheX
MSAAISARLAEVTMETLERLAFLFASPAEEPPVFRESELEKVRVDFTGPFSGGMELALSASVLAELAANMLGALEGTVLSADEQRDALRELANVVCGNLLPAIAGSAQEFNIHTPYLASADGPAWETPAGVGHLVLENGVCRVRMRVDGRLPPEVAADPCRLPEQG